MMFDTTTTDRAGLGPRFLEEAGPAGARPGKGTDRAGLGPRFLEEAGPAGARPGD